MARSVRRAGGGARQGDRGAAPGDDVGYRGGHRLARTGPGARRAAVEPASARSGPMSAPTLREQDDAHEGRHEIKERIRRFLAVRRALQQAAWTLEGSCRLDGVWQLAGQSPDQVADRCVRTPAMPSRSRCAGPTGGCGRRRASAAAGQSDHRRASRRPLRGRRARYTCVSALSHSDGSRPSRDQCRAPAGARAPPQTAPRSGQPSGRRASLPVVARPRAGRSIGIRARRPRGGSPGSTASYWRRAKSASYRAWVSASSA